jgi:hypothetical protein
MIVVRVVWTIVSDETALVVGETLAEVEEAARREGAELGYTLASCEEVGEEAAGRARYVIRDGEIVRKDGGGE